MEGHGREGTEQWKGSSQSGKALHSSAAALQVALQGKGEIWDKAGSWPRGNLPPQRAGAGWGRMVLQVATAGLEDLESC